MGVVAMLRDLLFARPVNVEAEAARFLARRIGDHADAIKDSAQKYIRARDPFAALMADMYNRDQVSRIWKGNNERPPP